MPGYPFMKIYTEMLDDVKLVELDDSQKWRFIQLILLAGECDAGGAFVTGDSRMTVTQMSWRLRCDKNTLECDIDVMLNLGLLKDDHGLMITNFEKRQGPKQSEQREKWAERQRKHRERTKKVTGHADVTGDSRVTHGGVTSEEKEEEKELINAENEFSASKRRNPSPETLAYYDLQKHFLSVTGLPKPDPQSQGEWREFNSLWRSPGLSILKWVEYDQGKAHILIEEAVNQMSKDRLTIANFKSIVKVASDCYRSRNNGRT